MAGWRQQPPVGATVKGRWRNNLVVAGFAAGGGFYFDNVPKLPTITGALPTTTKFGRGIKFAATTDLVSLPVPYKLLPQTGETTVLVVYAKNDATNRSSFVFDAQPNNSSTHFSVHGPYSDGTIYWDFGAFRSGGSDRLAVSGQTWTAGISSVWVYTAGPRGMEVWRDGVLVGSGGYSPNYTPDASGPNTLEIGSTTSGVSSDISETSAFHMWGRQLSPSDIIALSRNPYAPFTRKTFQLYAPASSGAITGTSTLTFTPTGTLKGAGALTSTSTITFTPTGTMTGAGAMTSASSITFTPTGTLSGSGAMSATSVVNFTPTGTLKGAGALTSTSTVTFALTGTLTGTSSGQMTGSSSVTLSVAGAMAGAGLLSGSSAFNFTVSGVLTNLGSSAGRTLYTVTLDRGLQIPAISSRTLSAMQNSRTIS